ncbi:methyltransferase [Zopfia rhizophila CBS 207.26]|uniref:Methyltransferase n=1 Tax=Zopfia rhizophila CBS 207.26 TaxID=1314779 RepID=A0A6A6E4J1_9PEZI|nr:methyltransferase [Zopfia rhizophila CBS 207.26]
MAESKTYQDAPVTTSLFFLARLPVYDSEKPFTLRYDPGHGLPASNVESEEHEVQVHNMRLHKLSYEECGFQYCKISSAMQYGDYAEEHIIRQKHFPEVKACLKNALGAAFVEIIDLAQRKREASFPISTGTAYEHEQPVLRAHIADVTLESVKNTIRQALGARAEPLFQRHWQFVNVWHPQRGPLFDYPLAVCDASTVDFEADTMAADLVTEHEITETVEVQYSAKQKWYYLAQQQPDELLLFKNVDSRCEEGMPPGTPHAAFKLQTEPENVPLVLRESVELRAFVVW